MDHQLRRNCISRSGSSSPSIVPQCCYFRLFLLTLRVQLGMGTYGLVYKAKWKGVNVAVKRFIKQKMDERLMLEFRSEAAMLANLHHPNLVLFIGIPVLNLLGDDGLPI